MAESSTIVPPTDGRGGPLWNSNITFPVYPSILYPNGGFINVTWAHLDAVINSNEQLNATAGICFGFCILAFLNIVALTPRTKIRLPIYCFTLLTLAILATRYLSLIVLFTALEDGSAYYKISQDFAGGTTAQSTIASLFVIWTPTFALFFVVLCFYVQGKCVLVAIAMKHRYLYLGIMTYLISLSILTLAFRLGFAVCITIAQFNMFYTVPSYMHQVVLATYSATILSWCLVYSWQVGSCVRNRRRLGATMDKNEGMAILFMTGVESMLIPIIFTILQLCNISWFAYSEFLVMPSIACIIPFGSIWASAVNQRAALQRTSGAQSFCNNCSEMLTPSNNTISFQDRL